MLTCFSIRLTKTPTDNGQPKWHCMTSDVRIELLKAGTNVNKICYQVNRRSC